jgi:hypothetical protein
VERKSYLHIMPIAVAAHSETHNIFYRASTETAGSTPVIALRFLRVFLSVLSCVRRGFATRQSTLQGVMLGV